MDADLLEATTLHDDEVVVVTCEAPLSKEQQARLLHELEQQLPDRKILVLPAGVRLAGLVDAAWLARVEAKLDAVLDLLEEEPQPERLTLDGAPAGGERDQTQPL